MPKSIEILDKKMEHMNGDSFRYHVLEAAKNFKSSWIELGRALYSVWKDKKYKEWGYQTFDAYTAREIGIRKQTSLKLLRSYYFLEKEEPNYLQEDYAENENVASLPSYEAVDVLRMAKNKKVDEDDYANLKTKVFSKGKDAHELRKDLTSLIRQREEIDPGEAYQKKKQAQIRRLLGTMKSLKNEIEASKMLPKSVIKDITVLISKLSEHIG